MKYRIGIALIVLSFLTPIGIAAIPYLGLGVGASGFVAGFLVLGLPEILFLVGGLLAGKEIAGQIKSRIFRRKHKKPEPDSQEQPVHNDSQAISQE